MSSLGESKFFSPTEQRLSISRPVEAPGYMPPSNILEDQFPFKLALTGITESLRREDSEAQDLPISAANGEALFGELSYATSSEVLAVGNAFPYHSVYEEWAEREKGWFRHHEAIQQLPADARVALIGVYLYVPVRLKNEILEHAEADKTRFEPHKDSPEFARYVFARGTSEQPLLEVTYQPSTMPSDLPPLNYAVLETIITEYEIATGRGAGALRLEVRELQLQETIQTATEAQLQLARLAVPRLASGFVGVTASEAECKAKQLELLNGLFNGQYIDIESDFASDEGD